MKMIFRSLPLSLLLLSAVTCLGDPRQEEVFPSFDSGVVVHSANLTWRNYVGWWNKTQGTPLKGDIELGSNLWAEGVARLNPKYVYTHGVNIVIVCSRHGEDEEGFYVALSIASEPGSKDEQFTRILIAQRIILIAAVFPPFLPFFRWRTNRLL